MLSLSNYAILFLFQLLISFVFVSFVTKPLSRFLAVGVHILRFLYTVYLNLIKFIKDAYAFAAGNQ